MDVNYSHYRTMNDNLYALLNDPNFLNALNIMRKCVTHHKEAFDFGDEHIELSLYDDGSGEIIYRGFLGDKQWNSETIDSVKQCRIIEEIK